MVNVTYMYTAINQTTCKLCYLYSELIVKLTHNGCSLNLIILCCLGGGEIVGKTTITLRSKDNGYPSRGDFTGLYIKPGKIQKCLVYKLCHVNRMFDGIQLVAMYWRYRVQPTLLFH